MNPVYENNCSGFYILWKDDPGHEHEHGTRIGSPFRRLLENLCRARYVVPPRKPSHRWGRFLAENPGGDCAAHTPMVERSAAATVSVQRATSSSRSAST